MIMKLETNLAVKEAAYDNVLLCTPEQVESYLNTQKDLLQEMFTIVTLTSKNRAIRKHLISLGVLDSTLVGPREIFKCAINDSAKSIILAHNHPSGDPTPSADDIKVTRQVVSAGEILGIKVLDHIILASDGCCSLREAGLVHFQ